MKSNITVNHIDKTMAISKSVYKKACIFGTNEYAELREAIAQNPTYTICFKTVEKKSYNGLTIAKMEEYIGTQNNSKDMLVKFKAVQTVAKAKGSLYPLTKRWFLETYPNYKEAISDIETATMAAALAEVETLEASMEAAC